MLTSGFTVSDYKKRTKEKTLELHRNINKKKKVQSVTLRVSHTPITELEHQRSYFKLSIISYPIPMLP